MRKILNLAVCLTSLCLVQGALAGPKAPQACSINDLPGATECFGGEKGNDQLLNPLTVNALNIFGGGWDYIAKQNTPGGLEGADIGLNVTPPGALSGIWSIADGALSNYEDYLVVLKAGNAFSAYLVEDTTLSSGTWSVDSWTKNGLSHFTFYTRGTSTTPTSISEPATALLFGLGALGLVRLRRFI